MIGDADFGVFYNEADFAVPAVLHLPGGDQPISVILSGEGARSGLPGGGFVDDAEKSFTAPLSSLTGLDHRHRVTVSARQWVVVDVVPLGDGRCRVVLGDRSNGPSAGQPDIRY